MKLPTPLDALRPSRRDFLWGAAAGAGALVPWVNALAQTVGRAPSPRRIDVHHHFTCPPFMAFAKKYNQTIGNYRAPGANPWDVNADLEDMDRSGVATALQSITTPGFTFGTVEEIRTVARECNEFAARLSADHKGRFGSFAAIPLTDTEGSLKEIEYALDTLGADGIALFSNYGSKWLGHESFAPVYEELNRRKAILFVHPITATCCANMVPGVNDNLIEFAADTTRTIASLIFSGTSSKYPGIRWIFSHGGGAMPFVIERFLLGSQAEIVPGIVTKGQDAPPPKNVPNGTLAEIRKMYFDTAQSSNPIAMAALRKVVPLSHIVFGTDYWYRTANETARGLTTNRVFTPAELHAINRGNVERLMPKYKG